MAAAAEPAHLQAVHAFAAVVALQREDRFGFGFEYRYGVGVGGFPGEEIRN